MSHRGTTDGLESLDDRVDQLNRVVSLFVDKVEADFDVSLGFEPGSIAYVDAILGQAHDSNRKLSPGLFLSAGGYLGEILIRNYDGEWVERDGDIGVAIEGNVHRQTIPVFEWIKEAYHNPNAESLTDRFQRVAGDGLGGQHGTGVA